MKVFGITGGVGAGKSEVLTYLGQNYDATVIQADEAGYLVMLPGISTHALTEGDVNGGSSMRSGYRFQLTPSRRATVQNFALVRVRCISTHALTEGD